MRPLSLVIGVLAAVTLSSVCCAQLYYDPFAEYYQREVTITPGAGNAQDANAAIQTIDPWPPYVGYTYIPGKGRAAVNSVERMYHDPNPFGPHGAGGPGGPAGPGAGPGFGTETPVQPINNGN